MNGRSKWTCRECGQDTYIGRHDAMRCSWCDSWEMEMGAHQKLKAHRSELRMTIDPIRSTNKTTRGAP